MEDNASPRSSDFKNVLPDVVHSQPISPALGPLPNDTTANDAATAKQNSDEKESTVSEISEAESISDHVASKLDSLSDSAPKPELASLDASLNNSIINNPSNIPIIPSLSSDVQDPSSSWLAEESTPVNHISNESPVVMPASLEVSNEEESLKSVTPQFSADSQAESSRNEFLDSLNDKSKSLDKDSTNSENVTPRPDSNSNSEEIIKLDIRGSGVPKFPFPTAKIFFGPPPEGGKVVEPNEEDLPMFPNLLSPFLIGGGDSAQVEEIFDGQESKEPSPVESFSDKEEDLLVEEMLVDETKEKRDSIPQPKSMPPEDGSFSTFTTDYKTICEEYQEKLTHLEAAIHHRDRLIQELTVSLQQNELQNDKQLSDLMKYETMVNETKFYSAAESNPSSIHSEKDMDNEEITIDHSKTSDSDLTGFDDKLFGAIAQYSEFMAENIRNELRESLLQVFCEEVGKIRLESDTEVRELETQLKQDKHEYTRETRKLRELLATVQAGNADIESLRQELHIKHEMEMGKLRTYFEKKCLDMERSFSEDVWRGKNCVSPASCSSLEGAAGGGAGGDGGRGDGGRGDGPRRRTRSADIPSLGYEWNTDATKQLVASVDVQLYKETIAALHDQITQLKAHIQTTENTVLYQQDIDLELEKALDGSELERIRQEVRVQVSEELQEKIQVLLSNPDAEPASWPPELVAIRDRIHEDVLRTEKESLPNEPPDGSDKWKQRRNLSFDQNRQLEQVTKERDDLKRVAVALQRVVAQLVSYCAAVDDELNKTVLAELLQRALYNDAPIEDSRPSTPNLSIDLNGSSGRGSGVGGVGGGGGRRVHFAPDLPSVLAEELDEEQMLAYFQEQHDLSIDIKRDLEQSLRRLRRDAHDLLDLSTKIGNKGELKKLESSQVKITELVEEMDARGGCSGCELLRKSMEEALTDSGQREARLRAELGAALAQLQGDFEGYGLALSGSRSLPAPPRCPPSPPLAPYSPAALSLDSSPRADELDRLRREREEVVRRNEDLEQQLEVANRLLLSSRKFLEEQAAEREAERDEAARAFNDLHDEKTRLAARLHSNAKILSEIQCHKLTKCNCRQHDEHVEQLEAQNREMNQIITDLETHKATADEEQKASNEKISLLRDIICNLEQQLEQKITHEEEILKELEGMRKAIDERDGRLRELVGELEGLRSERLEGMEGSTFCSRCAEVEGDLLEEIKEQARWLEESLHHRTKKLERIHEASMSSACCSEPSEDVSLADQRNLHLEQSAWSPSPRARHPLLAGVWATLDAHARADHAALKYVADLTRTAQEVRAERDVLQARMSEQALKLSSLAAKLEQQRTHAEAAARAAAGDLSVQLHDALAEVQRLTDEVSTKDHQLSRLRQNIDDRSKNADKLDQLYGNCNPQDKVQILERELTSAQTQISNLERVTKALEEERDSLRRELRENRRLLAEREEQLQEILALKLDEENQKTENRSEDIIIEGAKTSARTLSDIVSISDYDEQDLQMRRAEFRQNMSLNQAPYPTENKEKSINRTLPPELQKANMSSLNIDHTDHFDFTNTPRADSLPAHLTSTQNREFIKQTNKVNETVMKIKDNISLYPNRDISDSKDNSIDPKIINFSIEPVDNKADEFTSLRELGISLDVKQGNFPDILSQLKREIKKSKSELDLCKTELKNAEEQLCEFPALKEEVEALKTMLENTVAAMDNDKKFYENQLENFTTNKTLFEQKLTELSQEVADKTKDLNLLKEDILRRENMILELAKEKRNLTNKVTELEVHVEELKSRNSVLEIYEKDYVTMRDQISELKKLEQLVSEKNQQIDSLNQHLDRLDDLQRRLDYKTDEVENMKELLEEKANELVQLQGVVEALNRDIASAHEHNDQLNIANKDLKQKLTKMEKEQENQSLKTQSNELELTRLSMLNCELTSKINELKELTDKLKERETEIEMLNEDIGSFHEEIASLKEQLKLASRSPSPRVKEGKGEEGKGRRGERGVVQLARIRRQVALVQHELDFHKKELNDKAFELARAKLDTTELTANLSEANKEATEQTARSRQLQDENMQLQGENKKLELQLQGLKEQLQNVSDRMREESNTSELKQKLKNKSEECLALERELAELRDELERVHSSDDRLVPRGGRSPTAEMELALQRQLNYSSRLDEDIMEQILSASSDNEDIPRLALNTSKSSSCSRSSSVDLMRSLRQEKEHLALQLAALEARARDKDALIAELNRVRDKLVCDWQTASLRLEAERALAQRLQLQLDAQREANETVQNQDTSVIEMLKKRLEAALGCEQALRRQLRAARLPHGEEEISSRLKSELSVVRSKLEAERGRCLELQAAGRQLQAAAGDRGRQLAALRAELLEAKRLKHEAAVELVRAKELLHIQGATISELERKVAGAGRDRAEHGLASPRSASSRALAPLRPDDRDQAIRYLHARCLRLESCRKALVWQKRYLQRVLAGYSALEASLAPRPPPRTTGGQRFKCVARAVLTVCRMSFLVRRRRCLRAAAAAHTEPHASPPAASPPRAPRRDLRLNLATDSPLADFIGRSPCFANSPRTNEPFLLSTPRSETAAAYLNKLELVSRCLNQAMDTKPLP